MTIAIAADVSQYPASYPLIINSHARPPAHSGVGADVAGGVTACHVDGPVSPGIETHAVLSTPDAGQRTFPVAGSAAVGAGEFDAATIGMNSGSSGAIVFNHTETAGDNHVFGTRVNGTAITIDAYSGATTLAGLGSSVGAVTVRGGELDFARNSVFSSTGYTTQTGAATGIGSTPWLSVTNAFTQPANSMLSVAIGTNHANNGSIISRRQLPGSMAPSTSPACPSVLRRARPSKITVWFQRAFRVVFSISPVPVAAERSRERDRNGTWAICYGSAMKAPAARRQPMISSRNC